MALKPFQIFGSSSEPWKGHIPKGVWGRKTHWRRALCLPAEKGFNMKYFFIGLFILGSLFQLASFSDHPNKKIYRYLGWGIYILMFILANIFLS
ncbi:MAG: hypothetical protein A3J48_02350 [Candidatus Doudnabacteria bacterium RIFCSPHIGHO2_02_FULL_46_11]|uniref:Uncharacterized protein n=1 Tax=Candidatus Doudnabacteria bacterium RIFCSPHIGHO2_02_FULL_46_11 TaxID=1817832 RepID=A0A1F5P8R0_9BACT|nr:MAG: hypothetical protein A3J48_02350 [Candidatus Doudnabacteria bacterium RIFCSPHIGHO2_02_FULL_46_11]